MNDGDQRQNDQADQPDGDGDGDGRRGRRMVFKQGTCRHRKTLNGTRVAILVRRS